jgi:hypothetical protein
MSVRKASRANAQLGCITGDTEGGGSKIEGVYTLMHWQVGASDMGPWAAPPHVLHADHTRHWPLGENIIHACLSVRSSSSFAETVSPSIESLSSHHCSIIEHEPGYHLILHPGPACSALPLPPVTPWPHNAHTTAAPELTTTRTERGSRRRTHPGPWSPVQNRNRSIDRRNLSLAQLNLH